MSIAVIRTGPTHAVALNDPTAQLMNDRVYRTCSLDEEMLERNGSAGVKAGTAVVGRRRPRLHGEPLTPLTINQQARTPAVPARRSQHCANHDERAGPTP